MDTMKLSVHEREETGNGPARRLRANGLIPAVSYANGKEATSISIALEDFRAAMARGHNVVLELDFGKAAKSKAKPKGTRYAVVKQVQYHPTKRNVLHVDLHEVDLAEEIEASVVIEAVGAAAGLRDGGMLDWERREVLVRALPGDVPQVLEIDVTELLIGHHLKVADLSAPEGVTIVDEPEAVLVAMLAPRVEQAPVVEAEEAAEPEVIGSDKTEE